MYRAFSRYIYSISVCINTFLLKLSVKLKFKIRRNNQSLFWKRMIYCLYIRFYHKLLNEIILFKIKWTCVCHASVQYIDQETKHTIENAYKFEDKYLLNIFWNVLNSRFPGNLIVNLILICHSSGLTLIPDLTYWHVWNWECVPYWKPRIPCCQLVVTIFFTFDLEVPNHKASIAGLLQFSQNW